MSQAGSSGFHQASTLRDYLHIVRRGWWLILLVAIIVPASAIFFSLRQEKLYEASAQVLVRSLESTEDERELQTQADVAAASVVVEDRVRRELDLNTLPDVDVEPRTDSDILVFSSTATSPDLAARVATAYATEYKNFQRDLVTADIRRERAEVDAEIAELQSLPRPQRDQTLYETLLSRRDNLQTLETLETSRALLVRPAAPGSQVQPKVVQNGILGLLLGLVIGLGLAFLRAALDTRVRSTDEVAERLGVPLLAWLPEPPRRLRQHDRLAMISDPDGQDAAALRILRANVDFVRLDTNARTLLVTSAGAAEGKSTTAANLAVALARVGQHVALVDLDLRRPSIHRFFDLEGPGIAEVATGRVTLEQALAPIPVVWPGAASSWNGNSSELRPARGRLEVLPAGTLPPNVDDVLANHVISGVIRKLEERADIVLVDSTPLLVGEGMSVTAAVDAVLVVVNMNNARRPIITKLRHVLDTIPARNIGFVATGKRAGDTYEAYPDYQTAAPRPREPVA